MTLSSYIMNKPPRRRKQFNLPPFIQYPFWNISILSSLILPISCHIIQCHKHKNNELVVVSKDVILFYNFAFYLTPKVVQLLDILIPISFTNLSCNFATKCLLLSLAFYLVVNIVLDYVSTVSRPLQSLAPTITTFCNIYLLFFLSTPAVVYLLLCPFSFFSLYKVKMAWCSHQSLLNGGWTYCHIYILPYVLPTFLFLFHCHTSQRKYISHHNACLACAYISECTQRVFIWYYPYM